MIRTQLLTRTSPAPLLDKIEFQFENRKVEGTLFDEQTLSKDELLLRSHSNDAGDAAWAALSVIERIPMTAEEVRRLGKDPDTVVKIPPSYGSSDLRFSWEGNIAEKYPNPQALVTEHMPCSSTRNIICIVWTRKMRQYPQDASADFCGAGSASMRIENTTSQKR